MSEKRKEFINSLRTDKNNDDGGNIFFAARLESEAKTREAIREAEIEKLPDKANVWLSKKMMIEEERRRAKREEK